MQLQLSVNIWACNFEGNWKVSVFSVLFVGRGKKVQHFPLMKSSNAFLEDLPILAAP